MTYTLAEACHSLRYSFALAQERMAVSYSAEKKEGEARREKRGKGKGKELKRPRLLGRQTLLTDSIPNGMV